MPRFAFAVIALLAFTAVPARAEHAQPADLTVEDKTQLTRIEDYLNDLTTAKAGFTQIGSNGDASTGTFYLSRPGKLRFDYAAPTKDIIIADGKFIWYYDAKLKDANHAPISRTFADFLLRREIKLTGEDVTVTDFQMGNTATTLTLTQTDDPGEGSLTLTLSNHPLQIQKWRVVDSNGRVTQIALDHAEFGMALDPALFVWKDPDDQ